MAASYISTLVWIHYSSASHGFLPHLGWKEHTFESEVLCQWTQGPTSHWKFTCPFTTNLLAPVWFTQTQRWHRTWGGGKRIYSLYACEILHSIKTANEPNRTKPGLSYKEYMYSISACLTTCALQITTNSLQSSKEAKRSWFKMILIIGNSSHICTSVQPDIQSTKHPWTGITTSSLRIICTSIWGSLKKWNSWLSLWVPEYIWSTDYVIQR